MANRVVIVGPNDHGKIECLEVPDANDAYGMIQDGVVRATVTRYGGPLADATVLTWPTELARASDTNKAADQWWAKVKGYRGLVRFKEFTINRDELA